MAVDVGTARVIITGDYSTLASSFAAAQPIAAAGAQAIGKSVSTAFEPASLIVDQFGRSIRSMAAAVETAAPPVLDLEGAVIRLAFAQAILKEAIDNSNNSLGHQVSQVQAASAAIRVGLGEQSIRAVERLLTMIPGLGAALQVAFPLFGIAALTEALYRAGNAATGLKDAQAELQRQTQATDAAFEKAAKSIQTANVELLSMRFGAANGKDLAKFYAAENAQDDLDKIETLKQQIKGLAEVEGSFANAKLLIPFFGSQSAEATVDKIRALGEQITALQRDYAAKQKDTDVATLEAQRASLSEQGALASARITNQLAANRQEELMSRSVTDIQINQAHATNQAKIDAMHDTLSASVASAAEEVRLAQERETKVTDIISTETEKRIALIRRQGAAEALGKPQSDQNAIAERTRGQVAEAEGTAAQQIIQLRQAVDAAKAKLDEADASRGRKIAEEQAKEWESAYDAITKAAKQTSDENTAAVNKDLAGLQKVMEIQAKGEGQTKELGILQQKLVLERQYGLEVGHTLAQQVDFLNQIANLENQARQAKVDGLKAELLDAELIDDTIARKTKVAQIQAEINALEAQGANATIEANTKIAETIQKQTLGNQLAAQAERAPAALGQGLAKGVIDGKGIGKDIRDSLKGIGKEMLGDVFSKGIEQMVIAITGNTVATNLNTLWTELMAIIPHPFGFAAGGRPQPGVPYIVGENGPELRVDDGPGTIIPNGAFALPSTRGHDNFGPPVGSQSVATNTSFQTHSVNVGEAHFHGVQDVRQMMREISDIAKSSTPAFSPYTK